jgi:hypothetical protein
LIDKDKSSDLSFFVLDVWLTQGGSRKTHLFAKTKGAVTKSCGSPFPLEA